MTTAREDAEEPLSGPFDIYETADGPRHIGNPMRRQILAKMRGRELTVPEMIQATALTKSTISTHLAILHGQKLVAYREDPADRRRKLYYLTSRHVGTARRCAERLQVVDAERDLPLEDALADGVVPRLLLRAFLTELSCCGLDLEPVARETGRRVGEVVGRDRAARDIDEWALGLTAFWMEAGLGKIRFIPDAAGAPARVVVDECRICCNGTDNRVGLCAVTAGLLEGMASEALRTMVQVRPLAPDDAPNVKVSGCACRFEVVVPPSVAAVAAEPGS